MPRIHGQIVLTVAELIEELKKWPPDALVYTEGCDCDGEASFVRDDTHPADKKPAILICRSEDPCIID